jgi:hypothetical protein
LPGGQFPQKDNSCEDPVITGVIALRGGSMNFKIYNGDLGGFRKASARAGPVSDSSSGNSHGDTLGKVIILSNTDEPGFDLALVRAAAFLQNCLAVLDKRLEAQELIDCKLAKEARSFLLYLSLVFALRFHFTIYSHKDSKSVELESLLEEFQKFTRLRIDGKSLITFMGTRVRETLSALGLSKGKMKLLDKGKDPFDKEEF